MVKNKRAIAEGLMSKSRLPSSILALTLGLIFAGYNSAQASRYSSETVSLASEDRLGDAAIFQYYTVNASWQTFFRIINTSSDAIVAKVRFREAANSREVLDFEIALSPYDMWVGWTDNDALSDGEPGIRTNDTSCVFPPPDTSPVEGEGWETLDDSTNLIGVSFKARAFTDPYDDGAGIEPLTRKSEGHLEVIGVSSYDSDGSDDDEARFVAQVSHNAVTGKPNDCQGAYFSYLNSEDDGDDVDNVLAANAYLINVPTGQGAGYDPEMLKNCASRSLRDLAVETNTNPDLDNCDATAQWGRWYSDYSRYSYWGWRAGRLKQKGRASYGEMGNITPVTGGIDRVSEALMRRSVINEWAASNNPASVVTDVYTQWVLTFPTKHYYVDLQDDAVPTDDISPTLVETEPEAFAPFSQWFQEGDERGTSCEPYTISMYNREERAPAFTSPAPNIPGELCYQTNVLTFNERYVDQGLASAFTVIVDPLNFPTDYDGDVSERGWAELTFTGVGTDDGLPGRSRSNYSRSSYYGLPVTGFMFTAYNISTGNNLTAINAHKYTRDDGRDAYQRYYYWD